LSIKQSNGFENANRKVIAINIDETVMLAIR